MIRRVVLVAAGLMFVAGCGGSDKTNEGATKPPEATPTLRLLSAGEACAQVQMVNDKLDGPGNWPIPTYGQFGEETASLAGESDPEIADALRYMSAQALKVGSMSGSGDDVIDAAAEWATEYQAVADICMRTDSPIGQLP